MARYLLPVPDAELLIYPDSLNTRIPNSAHGIFSMSLLSKHSPINTKSTHLSRVKCIALVLPIAVTAGCAGLQNRDIIDYTVSEAEYIALTTPAAPQKELVASNDTKQKSGKTSGSVLVAEAAAKAAQRKTLPEPVIAAAKPAPAPATVKMEDKKDALLPSLTKAEKAAEPELAAAIDINKLGFTPSVYASAGLGVSRINPDTSAAPGFDVADEVAAAGQVTLGVDLFKNLSVELHSADFGSTAISPQGRVNFHVNGVSALLYAGKAAGRYRRNGWNGFARIGYNEIENTPVGDVPFIEQSTARGSFGLGVEYNTRRGFGFRADATAFDGDVQYGQLGVLYRVGKKPKRRPLALAAKTPAAPKSPATPLKKSGATPVLQAALPKPSANKLTNAEAIALAQANPTARKPNLDSEIKLSQITPRIDQRADECTQLNGTINDVTFSNGSARLTRAASSELNNVAHTLNGCANRQVIVSAHTDNSGSAIANHHLSKMRARTVALYLGRRGVDINRISAVAYGESRPVTSNNSAEGRMQNRRVELEVR